MAERLLLAIDVGNTNVSFGLFAGDDDHLVHTWRIATDRRRTEDEYEVILHQLFQRHRIDPGDVDEVAMGTVVPPVRDTLVGVSRNLFRCEPWVLDPAELRAGITLRVDYPSEVGADRIAANGDVANKVGTYPLAVLADRHGVPFYVAAPVSTIDAGTPDGASIPIEERDPGEVVLEGAAFNPAFDVTPAGLVTAIVTEAGVLKPPYAESIVRALAA